MRLSDGMRTASARATDARISSKHSFIICNEIRGKKLERAKKILESMIAKKISLKGKYYTKASKKILELLENADANAKFRGLSIETLFVKTAKADRGYKFIRPKSRMRFRGRKAKVTNIEIVVGEKE